MVRIVVLILLSENKDTTGKIASWFANNSSVSERTKNVDLREQFVRDMIKDQVIEINFVKSAENDSDIMTKKNKGNITCMQNQNW